MLEVKGRVQCEGVEALRRALAVGRILEPPTVMGLTL